MHAALRPACLALKMLLGAALLSGATAAVRADGGAAPHWSYSGDTGPEHWASEDPAYATCGIGKRQSPIDIEHAARKSLPAIEFAYQPIALVITDTGHTFQVNVAPGSGGITIAGNTTIWCSFTFTARARSACAVSAVRWWRTSCTGMPKASSRWWRC